MNILDIIIAAIPVITVLAIIGRIILCKRSNNNNQYREISPSSQKIQKCSRCGKIIPAGQECYTDMERTLVCHDCYNEDVGMMVFTNSHKL